MHRLPIGEIVMSTTITSIDFAMLRELGEWAALGFYEGIDLPWPRAYGLAYRRLYEHMEVVISPESYLHPVEPLSHARTRTSHDEWHPTSLICDFNHNSGLRVNPQIAAEKQAEYPHYTDKINDLVADLRQRLPHFGGYTHNNPDIRRVVSEGFLAIEAELDHELAAAQREGDDAEAINLLLALKDYAEGVRAYHHRVSLSLVQAARDAEGDRGERLIRIAASFADAFLSPATTFIEGLLAVNFTWMLDGSDSIGRFDQVLGPLFAADLRAGTLDLNFARELLDELWQAFERLNGWNMQIGGYTPDGQDGTNALTFECLAACERNKLRRPNVTFRITKHTPESALLLALKTLAGGSGRPALYNDDLYIDTLYQMDLGLTLEDAREIGFGGCTETMISGMSNVGSLEGEINLAKALELALFDGFDPVTKIQQGPHTGSFVDFSTFDAFYAAVKRQIQYQTDAYVAGSRYNLTQRFHHGDPKLYRTLFTRDCVRRRKSFEAGGARYNWAVVSYQGIANLIDSLAAVRQCVFEERQFDQRELLAALSHNYVGDDSLWKTLRDAPKFGNDDARVDSLGRDIIGFAWEQLSMHETPRGGRYLPSCILFVTYLWAGQAVGATPDGRRALEVLTDSVGPAQGRDSHGPTAMLASVTTLPLAKAIGTPVLNLRLLKSLMSSESGLQAVASLVRTFFSLGGLQLQLSVVSKEEMLDAQLDPVQHRDLIVRIGGYSEFFNLLPKELQDSVIARTEYGLGSE